MRVALIIAVLCSSQIILSQNALFDDASQTKRAVIVGISQYQDERIDPLMYADKDAQAFATFLQSGIDGAVPKENIRLLLNEKATSGDLWRELQWLMDESKEGDQAIFYFSGHGDKETATQAELGFLLTYNSPYNLYPGGAFSLHYLKAAVSTLEEKGVDVILITDACRSGKLAGNDIGGNGATTAALANSFDKTVKILSCQPNEFSLEGTQWGGGRGAFSYHLIEGLMGLADSEPDGAVTLREIERYLEETVTREAAPKEQNPFTVGNKTAVLSLVDKKIWRKLKKKKEVELPSFDMVNTRGYDEGVLEKAGKEAKQLYEQFVAALDEGRLWQPEEECADFYFKQLMEMDAVAPIQKTLTRNFAAALQDGSLEAYNNYLKSDSSKLAIQYRDDDRFQLYPGYLKRASDLLGPNHYMYASLKARQLYFEGLVKRVEYFETGKQDSVLQEAITRQEESLEFEANNANAIFELGVLKYKDGYIDKAIAYFEQAIELAPTWSLPFDRLGAAYMDKEEFSKARDMYAKALELSPKALLGYANRNLGYAYQQLGELEQAEKYYLKAKDLDPEDPFIHYYLGSVYRDQAKIREAIKAFNTTLGLDPSFEAAYYYLGLVYQDDLQYEEAEKVLLRAVKKEPGNYKYQYHLGINYFYKNDFEQCIPILQKVEILNPEFTNTYYYLGTAYKAMGELDKAESVFERVLALDPQDPEYYFQLGLIQYEKEQFSPAATKFQEAVELDSNFFYASYYLGMTQLRQGMTNEAQKTFDKSLQLAPDEVQLLYQVGVVYYELEQLDQALTYLEKAESVDPNYGLTYYTLGLVYLAKGDQEKSDAYLQKAKEFGVDF